jgi:hypothetical protein
MRPRELLAKIGLAVCATLCALLLLEVVFRIQGHLENRGLLEGSLDTNIEIPSEGPVELGHIIRLSPSRRIVYELKSNLSVVYQGAATTIGADGFRRCGGAATAEPRRPTIVGLGDSIMFGLGVMDGETYLCVLNELLKESMPEIPWQVVNTAVPGYNTVMEVESLKQRGVQYRPEMVFIEFVGNDLSLPNFVRAKRPVFTLERSFLADFVTRRFKDQCGKSLWRRLKRAGLEGLDQEGDEAIGTTIDPSLVPPEYRQLVGWDAYLAAMRELQELSRLHGFTVLVLSLAPSESPLKSKALALAAELDFEALDVGSVLRRRLEAEGIEDYLGSPLALSETDGHPSALAHEIAARTVFEYLVREDLLRDRLNLGL